MCGVFEGFLCDEEESEPEVITDRLTDIYKILQKPLVTVRCNTEKKHVGRFLQIYTRNKDICKKKSIKTN